MKRLRFPKTLYTYAPALGVLLYSDALHAGTIAPIPEPSTWGLLAIGAIAGGAAALARKRRKK